MLICSNALFWHRNKWMNGRLSKAIAAALICNKFLQHTSKLHWIHFPLNKISFITAQNLQSTKTFFTLRQVNITKVAALLPKVPQWAGRCQQRLQPTSTWKHSVFVLTCQTSQLGKSVQEHGPKSSAIDFAVKILDWLEKLRYCHMTGRGLNLDSNFKNSAAWPTSCEGFYLLWKNSVEFCKQNNYPWLTQCSKPRLFICLVWQFG